MCVFFNQISVWFDVDRIVISVLTLHLWLPVNPRIGLDLLRWCAHSVCTFYLYWPIELSQVLTKISESLNLEFLKLAR
jgi:hypothetical protein